MRGNALSRCTTLKWYKKNVGRVHRYYGVMDGMAGRSISVNGCSMSRQTVYQSESIVGEVDRGYITIDGQRTGSGWWKCGEQEYNIELVMEGCGTSVPILMSGGWCRRKLHQLGWMLDGRTGRISLSIDCGMSKQRVYRN
ncbi:hypothetical protein T07_10560 [Trichinella nelsoni]|uniref:Uncharacterized protein n=1 Tax=Trichinella nelsoni TaxID=6336 RepID=A0A0V0REW9_9BILA|nr:hypothetical protein T07_10560 [Trichinella nelsoni]